MRARMLGSFIGFLGGAYAGFRWARAANHKPPPLEKSAIRTAEDSRTKPATPSPVRLQDESSRDNSNLAATVHAFATTTLAVILAFALRQPNVDRLFVIVSVAAVIAIIF